MFFNACGYAWPDRERERRECCYGYVQFTPYVDKEVIKEAVKEALHELEKEKECKNQP